MKLIIDIPEENYEIIKSMAKEYRADTIEDYIANGTPLEDIKAEIDQKQYDFMDDKDYDEGIRFGLMLAYQIIDKHIGG